MKKVMKTTFLIVSLIVVFSGHVSAGTTISKSKKADPNASVSKKGITTYYNSDLQKWKNISGENPLYKYQAKKDIRYYKPIFYLSTLWVPNNKSRAKCFNSHRCPFAER